MCEIQGARLRVEVSGGQYLAVEAAGAEECGVEHVRAVRRHDDLYLVQHLKPAKRSRGRHEVETLERLQMSCRRIHIKLIVRDLCHKDICI